MKKENRIHIILSAGLLILFVLYTIAVMQVDVRPIGPNNSQVGFAAINQWVHNQLGVNMNLYIITDKLSIVALLIAAGFGGLGIVQWIKSRKLSGVDRGILCLGGFYLLVIIAYVFFEKFVVNYRPILIDGILEASYPSSTTMLVMCIMPTAMMQFHRLIHSRHLRWIIHLLCIGFTAFMVIGRLVSGVHWFTDILGGALLSAGLVMVYVVGVTFTKHRSVNRINAAP